MSFFAPLPTGFPLFDKVLSTREVIKVVAPPAVLALGERLRAVYAAIRVDDYAGLGIGDLRKLPYAYFIAGKPDLLELDPNLVNRYWTHDLPSALNSGSSRAKRWLRPLFFAYCECFDIGSEPFCIFALKIRSLLSQATGAFATELRRLQTESRFFEPDHGPGKLAQQLIDSRRSIDEWLSANLLWPEFTDSPMGQAVFKSVLALDKHRLSDSKAIDSVLAWCGRMPLPVIKTPHRIDLAVALLRPWIGIGVGDSIKTKLSRFFIEKYGDPRLQAHRLYQWQDVREDVVRVLLRWLAGDTLRGFIKILERTADDDSWRYRQKFWMAYYDAGHIEEAWLVLGRDAMWRARQMFGGQSAVGLAELEGGASADQSVLLFRLGDLLFTEWSHNGSLRAYREGSGNGPRLYEKAYSANELRAMVSLDFHQGFNERPQLTHSNSSGGTWQRKARDFIRRRTGVRMQDREILL